MRTITTEQAKRASESLRPIMQYVARVRDRLQEIGFSRNDRLYQRACRAHAALFDLECDFRMIVHGGTLAMRALEGQQDPMERDEGRVGRARVSGDFV